METTMTVTEAVRNFPDLINRVTNRGDTAVITRDGSVVARIVPEPPKATGKFREMRNKLPRLSPEESEQFALDIENGRERFNTPSRDPWEE
jgi:antitoxin (DNA-binding transcriptional repressor) of toxin-antitoxin stability system